MDFGNGAMFEESFTEEFEENLMDTVEDRVGIGGRVFLEEHNEGWRGYHAIIRNEASQRGVLVDDLSSEIMVESVVGHLEEFRDEYELHKYAEEDTHIESG